MTITQGAKLLPIKLKEKGWTQLKLTLELGVSEGLVNHWIHGRREPPGWATAKMEDILGVPARLWAREPVKRRSRGKAA